MPILTETYSGSPGGMNLALPQQEIDDTEARYIQDALLDFPGLVRRRGPIQKVASMASPTNPASGFVVTTNPRGATKYAVLHGTGATGKLGTYSDDLASVVDHTWPHVLPTDPVGSASTAFRIVDSKPALKGGSWVGVASDWSADGALHGMALWKGGNKANYTTGTLSVTRSSTAVTGSGTSWTANVAPGMFLFANTDDPYTSAYIGTVLAVNSNTSITLEAASPYTCTAKAYTLQSIRGFIPKVGKGRITTDTTSAVVNGGNTKFQSQGLGTGAWHIFRQSDMAYVGKVTSVASEISLTLTANASISMADQAYVAIRGDWATADTNIDITGSANKTGWINAIYAERQWYANNGAQFDKTYRLWFSDTSDPETVDLTSDGDWIPISSTSEIPEAIRGLAPCYNSLLVFKATETFAVFGNSPSSFSAKKMHDDGVLSTMSIQTWGGGAIWAGAGGIYFFDGITVANLTSEKLGDAWKNSIRTVDPTRYRMWSMMARDHYFLYIENLAPTVSVQRGITSKTPTHWVVCINMNTRAITMMTNIGIRGAAPLPATSGQGVWYVANDSAGTAFVCDANKLFDAEGLDDFISATSGEYRLPSGTTYPNSTTYPGPLNAASAVTPDFFYESKKFNVGDDMQLKRWKQLGIHYLAQGGQLDVDTVLGLNQVGKTLSTGFPATVYTWDNLPPSYANWDALVAQFGTWADLILGVFAPKRVRFLKKAQHLSFRIYQDVPNMPRVKLGPFHVGFKLMRKGRV